MGSSFGRGFYDLTPGWGAVWYEAEADFQDPFYSQAMRGFQGTVQAKIVCGTRPGDMMRPRSVLSFVSERFVEALQENAFTGWGTYDVELSGGKGPLPKYYGLVAYGVGGPMLPDESEAEFNSEGRVKALSRLVFDMSRWDGSDIFYTEPLSLGICVTERVAQALKKAKLKNLSLQPLEDLSFNKPFTEEQKRKFGIIK